MSHSKSIEVITEEDRCILMDICNTDFTKKIRSKRPKKAQRMEGRLRAALRSLRQLLRC